MEYNTKSAEETKAVGERFSTHLNRGDIVAFSGELGAGKTTFIQGIAKGLGIKGRIISPTFIILRKYDTLEKYDFYHVDLYRLEGNLKNETENLGLTEIFEKKKDIVVIEWAEKIKDLLPGNTIWVDIQSTDENQRVITIGE